MRTLRALALIPATAILLVACGNDESAGSDSTVAETTVPAADTSATETTVPGADTTAAPETSPQTAPDGPVQIDVVVGVDSGEDRVELVKVGSEVQLNITNPDAADEFHIHGIELEKEVEAGVTATFNFVADAAGTYEVESHITEDVLVVIQVG
ncbi:MAG: hypothetical protein RL238_3447 [Actinomycetota bacterium]|jgi:hypothetical protein